MWSAPLTWAILTGTVPTDADYRDILSLPEFEERAGSHDADGLRVRGLGRRRRAHAAVEPRGLRSHPPAAARAARRGVDRHPRDAARARARVPDPPRADRLPSGAAPGRRDRDRARRGGRRHHLDRQHRHDHADSRDRRGRGRAALVPALLSIGRGFTRDLVQQAEEAGCEALCLTVDSPIIGPRNRQARAGSGCRRT